MLSNLKNIPVRFRLRNKFYSNIAGVKVIEQKVRVGPNEINYVKSELQNGIEKKKSLVLMPGALGLFALKFMTMVFYLTLKYTFYRKCFNRFQATN